MFWDAIVYDIPGAGCRFFAWEEETQEGYERIIDMLAQENRIAETAALLDPSWHKNEMARRRALPTGQRTHIR